jgi:hypothetical protein
VGRRVPRRDDPVPRTRPADHERPPDGADAEEDRLLSGPVDANDLDRVRKRIVAGLDEAFEMMEQTGAAPGAKWGDLTSAVYSASGDLIHISTGGVLAFASVLHYPVRFINKYWIGDPTVGVHDGDAFIQTTPATATSTTPTRA